MNVPLLIKWIDKRVSDLSKYPPANSPFDATSYRNGYADGLQEAKSMIVSMNSTVPASNVKGKPSASLPMTKKSKSVFTRKR